MSRRLLLGAAIFLACDDTPADGIYLTGYLEVDRIGDNVSSPVYGSVYWVNGEPFTLADGDGAPADIAVADSSVLMVGEQNDSAVLWEDREPVALASSDSSACCIALADGDVVIAGSQYGPGGVLEAVYWMNGEPHRLAAGTRATGLAVADGDVYVLYVDYQRDGPATRGGYFVNGTDVPLFGPEDLEENTSISLSSIAVAGDDVYVVGHESVDNGFGTEMTATAMMWTNGEPSLLAENAHANAVSVSEGDVYVAGVVFPRTDPTQLPQATYWKNGVATSVRSVGEACTWALDIAVVDGDVYLVGWEEDICDDDVQPVRITAVWKNGALTRKDAPRRGDGERAWGGIESVAIR